MYIDVAAAAAAAVVVVVCAKESRGFIRNPRTCSCFQSIIFS
jgi:hypothetical protein